MAWLETDYSKGTQFRWKIKWRLGHLGAMGTMGERTPLILLSLMMNCTGKENQTISLQLHVALLTETAVSPDC